MTVWLWNRGRMDPDHDARVLLGLPLDEPTRHFSDGELASLLGWSQGRIDDALRALEGDRLAHRQGELSFASRAALRVSLLVE